MRLLSRLGLALAGLAGLAAAQEELGQDQTQQRDLNGHPPTIPPARVHRRQDGPVTITSVSTSVSVSVSVYTSTETATATSVSTSTTTATTTDATRVVPIFYLDERAFEGLPYTLLHRVCGSAVGVDGDGGATTYVITTTRVDLVAPASPTGGTGAAGASTGSTLSTVSSPSAPRHVPSTTATPISAGASAGASPATLYNATGPPSTITQGPTTFVFSGTRWGDPSRTIVNQCRLSGTTSARCNLTHVGPIWYTGDPNWNGTYSTYNYTWTSGDRYGFAPCTVTQGVNLLGPPAPTAATSSNAGAVPAWAGGAVGRTASSGTAGWTVAALLFSPQVRNLAWPLLGMVGFMAGLFTLA